MKINRYIIEQKLNEDDSFLTTSDGMHTDTSIDVVLDHSKNSKELKENIIDWLRLRKLATSTGPNDNIAKILNRYDPQFIDYFIKCIGKNALSDGNNLFLNFLNNPSANNVVGLNKNNFTDAYNLLLRNNKINLDYVKDGDSLIYLPELYSNLDSNDTRSKLIDLDLKAAGIDESLITEDEYTQTASGLYIPSNAAKDIEQKEVKKGAENYSKSKAEFRQELKSAIKNRTIDDLFRKNNIDNSYIEPASKLASKIKALNDSDKAELAKELVGNEKAGAMVNAMKEKESADKRSS